MDILWTRRSFATTSDPQDYPGLFQTWSVPAVANDTFSTSKLTFGAGINPTSLINAQQDASIFVVDPTTGTLQSTTVVAPLASPGPVVGHQTFTDSILFQTDAAGFQNDNIANLSLQGDENGRVNALFGNWAGPTSKVLIDLNASATDALGTDSPQPLYYSPAANGIGKSRLPGLRSRKRQLLRDEPDRLGLEREPALRRRPAPGLGLQPLGPGLYVHAPSVRPDPLRRDESNTRSPMLPSAVAARRERDGRT